jgi:hypothetical protein
MSDKSDVKDEIMETNMPLEKFLSTAFLVPMGDPSDPECIWGLPVCLHGSPGIGKTARVRQASAAVGLISKTVNLGGRQPEDASGAPFVTKNQHGQEVIVIACILGAVNELNAHGSGVLFFDELTCARPATQGAFLSAMDERRVGDVQFRPRVRVVAAGNPPEEAAGGFMLQPPMANRFAHRDVSIPKIEDFLSYILQGPQKNIEPIENGERLVIEEWSNHYPIVAGLLAGYVERFRKIYEMPKQGNKFRGKSFLTPRTLEYAVRAVTTCRILGHDAADQAELVTACTGPGTGNKWAAWIRESNLPHPEDVLKNGWKPDTVRLDRTMAVYAGLAAYALSRPDKNEKGRCAALAWRRLEDLIKSDLPDIALPPAKALVNAGFSTKGGEVMEKASRPVLLYLGKKGFGDYIAP